MRSGKRRSAAKHYLDLTSHISHLTSKGGRSEKAQATVYQKHRSLLNRKMKYRG